MEANKMKTKGTNGNGHIGKNGHGHARPVLQFEHVERQSLPKCEVDVRIVEMIRKYPAYIRELTGHEPSIGEVIEKAVDKVLTSDAGFREWLNQQAGKSTGTEQLKAESAG